LRRNILIDVSNDEKNEKKNNAIYSAPGIMLLHHPTDALAIFFFSDARCQFAFLPPHFPWRRSYQHVAMFHKMLPFLQHEPHQNNFKTHHAGHAKMTSKGRQRLEGRARK
jgi:hypothetical protein